MNPSFSISPNDDRARICAQDAGIHGVESQFPWIPAPLAAEGCKPGRRVQTWQKGANLAEPCRKCRKWVSPRPCNAIVEFPWIPLQTFRFYCNRFDFLAAEQAG